MSFRKRGIGVALTGSPATVSDTGKSLVPGSRPSPLDGRLTISTGTRSLDALLAGHAGLPLGTSLLLEENGTTDFAGVLLRYYAAEGILQGHRVHVLGLDNSWAKELPGVAVEGSSSHPSNQAQTIPRDELKIAWRYEKLNNAETARAVPSLGSHTQSDSALFCHDFDLSKRLASPFLSSLICFPFTRYQKITPHPHMARSSFFDDFLIHLQKELDTAPSTSIHRLVIPALLSPTLYPPAASNPDLILQFLHALRALLRTYSTRLTALVSLPISLYPRTTGVTRWAELLSDGVLELAPFPSDAIHSSHNTATATMTRDELPQGIIRVHRIPVFHEKGGGFRQSASHNDDLAFSLSRRRGLVINPFSLPPVDGNLESHPQQGNTEGDVGKVHKVAVDF